MEKAKPTDKIEIAILAGGCFWGMEDLIRKLPGVVDTEVGYSGGETPNPVYRDVKTGRTGHAEAIQIWFDPNLISFDQLLEVFFKIHDPTTVNRQGNDLGSQYRSAIFFRSDTQKVIAESAIVKAQASGRWARPIVTEVVPFRNFTPAEPEHQDYLEKHPDGYTCHYYRD